MDQQNIELRAFPSDQRTKELISNAIFGSSSTENLQPFYQYYSWQCKQITSIFLMNGIMFPIATHADILEIVRDIRTRVPRADVKTKLSSKYEQVSDAQLENAIDLALRLLLMTDVGHFDHAYTGRECLTWKGDLVDELVCGIFGGEPKLSCDTIKLDTGFTALSLERICGFNVMLTTNLADHLRWREDLKTVTIFHHVTFLQHHKRSNTVYPDGFLDETIQTLALLFPKGDRAVEKWYRRKAPAEELDFAVLKCGTVIRQIENYRFWRDRLVQLKEAFDYSRPRNLKQWWHDRRDGIQWYTLWVAIFFTVLFGLIQSVEGAIQLYREYHPPPT